MSIPSRFRRKIILTPKRRISGRGIPIPFTGKTASSGTLERTPCLCSPLDAVPVLLSLDRGRGGMGTARPSLGLERSWPPGGLLAFRVWSISSFLLPVMSVVWSRACPSLPLAPGGLTVADSPPRPQTGRREPPASVLTRSAVFPAHSCFSVGFPFCLNLLTSHILQTSITCFSNIKYFLMFHSVHITSSYLKKKQKTF